MTIDWGDGTSTTVSSVEDYVHTYTEAGQYHITVGYDDWENVELSYSSSTSPSSPIAEARTSIAKIYAIPQVANTSFRYLFYNYTNLTEVASDTFANNPQITSFQYTFRTCSNLTSIPGDLFANNTAVTSFHSTFFYCPSLTVIPNGLFDNCPAVDTFYSTFWQCFGLSSIPDGLFDNNTAVTTFRYTFQQCTSLISIPEQLFTNNTAVTSFYGTFWYCSSLTNNSVYIGSRIVSSASYFMTGAGSGNNTVYVPAGSTTYTTFSSLSNLGCTVATYTP